MAVVGFRDPSSDYLESQRQGLNRPRSIEMEQRMIVMGSGTAVGSVAMQTWSRASRLCVVDVDVVVALERGALCWGSERTSSGCVWEISSGAAAFGWSALCWGGLMAAVGLGRRRRTGLCAWALHLPSGERRRG